MSFLPKFDAPAQHWVDAGLAVPTEKGKGANFADMAFSDAQANQLVYSNRQRGDSARSRGSSDESRLRLPEFDFRPVFWRKRM